MRAVIGISPKRDQTENVGERMEGGKKVVKLGRESE